MYIFLNSCAYSQFSSRSNPCIHIYTCAQVPVYCIYQQTGTSACWTNETFMKPSCIGTLNWTSRDKWDPKLRGRHVCVSWHLQADGSGADHGAWRDTGRSLNEIRWAGPLGTHHTPTGFQRYPEIPHENRFLFRLLRPCNSPWFQVFRPRAANFP